MSHPAPLPHAVAGLIERFSRSHDAYKDASYNETNLRREFLDPLFEALGWDLTNKQGYADAYKDVIHEDSIKVAGPGGGTKAPDYCFRIGGTRKFFLEAKKPSVDIKGDPSPAYQLRRYAWSAKLPISVLSDFEEFAIYDTRVKPDVKDKSSAARIFYCRYTDFPEKWPDIAAILSKDAILKGAFDKYADSTRSKRGTAQVDDAFLHEIEAWRDALAANLALRNPELSERDLNFAVTKTIDRIVFLRICEDRGIELYAQLQTIAKTNDIYGELLKLFNRADEKYNSGLFHFHKEKDRPGEHDELTPRLAIDDKTLRPILASLYYPDCPYEFSVLPADILGHVYEQFLGKVIRLTPGHRAKVEEKPEVRKAGGVYYTPTYIVDYIVQNTLGKLLGTPDGAAPAPPGKARAQAHPPEGPSDTVPTDAPPTMTPKDAAKLKLLDPACGSGSFLLGAYQYLLDWHLRYYLAHNPESLLKSKNPPIYASPKSSDPHPYRLTLNERKRILLNNIHGVDIDHNAVETTKLSLLLKALEGESDQSISNQMKLFRERALPDLGDNIKRGNSLIESDYYRFHQSSLLDDDAIHKIATFDWSAEFASTMKSGGFDVVVGNPPYDVMEKERGESSWPHHVLATYVKNHKDYTESLGGKLNLFRFFLVRGMGLLKSGGLFGMIVPMAVLADISCAATRRFIFERSDAFQADCFPQKDNANRRVFLDAKLSTCILTAKKSPRVSKARELDIRVYPWNTFNDPPKVSRIRLLDTAKFDPKNAPIPLTSQENLDLALKLHSISNVRRLGDVPDFVVTRGEINQTIYREYITTNPKHARLLKGVEVGRFHIKKEIQQGQHEWLDEAEFLRREGPRSLTKHTRIATQRITGVDDRIRIIATLMQPPAYFADSTNSIASAPQAEMSLHYLLALLNSRLFQWRFKLTSSNNNVATNELEALPVPSLDLHDSSAKQHHDLAVSLTTSMLTLHRQLAVAKTGREQIQRQIDATDRQIDQLVYQLYHLTPDEIQLVEAATP